MRYRAEQVGSLLRPPEVFQARAGGLPSTLREVENQSILNALAKQKEIGIDILTDGEMRRASWLHNMTVAVEGFVPHKIMEVRNTRTRRRCRDSTIDLRQRNR